VRPLDAYKCKYVPTVYPNWTNTCVLPKIDAVDEGGGRRTRCESINEAANYLVAVPPTVQYVPRGCPSSGCRTVLDYFHLDMILSFGKANIPCI
jgi:hypothetical protein